MAALLGIAALLPAILSAAPSKFTIDFNTDGNIEGFTGTNVTGLAVAGGFITGTATNGDPRIIKSSATAFFTKPASAEWQTVRFRVRETDTNSTVVVPEPYDLTGVLVQINSTSSAGGATSDNSRSAVASGDGFYTYTGNISGFTANEIRWLRVDPIGGPDAAGNFFEVDFIEVTLTNTPPALVSTTPADGATGIAPTATLSATFDERIFLNTTGSVTIKNLTTSTDTVISLPGPDPDGTLTVLGNVLTISPTANLGVPGDEIAIEISADAIMDADDAFYPGLLSTDNPNWSFTIDNIPPVPNYVHPIPGSGNAPLDGALFIVLNKNVSIGSGNLVLHRADDTIIETIDVSSGSVSVTGSRVTITPTVPLAHGTSYYVLIDSGAFTDALGNDYGGISDSAEWTFTTIANDPTVLFGDSFNRSNSTDLNESASGKYGFLGALNYTSRVTGVGHLQLSAGQLLLQSNEAPGGSGALVYINNHNFIDPLIATSGGFSISVDINAYSTLGAGRYMSVGVGQSLADLDAQTSSTTTGSSADLVVGYRNTATGAGVYIFKNGSLDSQVTTALPAPPTKMRIDYSLSDFNVGSTVDFMVFFDDSETAFTSGSFTWSGNNENYISLSSNLFLNTTAGARNSLFDNFQIRANEAPSGTGFDTWKTVNGATGQTLDDDHDGDGVPNGIEYFIGGPNGNTSGFTALPGVTNDAGTLSVTFSKAADYTGVYGTHYEVQVSSTLDGWISAPGGSVTFPSSTEVKYTFPTGTRNFARLVVTGP